MLFEQIGTEDWTRLAEPCLSEARFAWLTPHEARFNAISLIFEEVSQDEALLSKVMFSGETLSEAIFADVPHFKIKLSATWLTESTTPWSRFTAMEDSESSV